ncbi:MAG: 30S ribosome-binding factor RbfA [Lachnospiraceae bacterium]|nr:30S ribosome-binding factor RbfA [Lachnospiraceae bacterium]
MRKNSTKNNRINGEVMRALSSIIREVKDPRVGPLTSVIDVIVAPDLKTCKVYISILGGPDEAKSTLDGLNSAKGFIRRELAHIVNLRNTPELTFIMDDSIAYGVDMSKKIEEVLAHDGISSDVVSDDEDEDIEDDDQY